MIVNATQRTIQTIQRLLSIETSARRLDCTVSLKPSYYQRGSISRYSKRRVLVGTRMNCNETRSTEETEEEEEGVRDGAVSADRDWHERDDQNRTTEAKLMLGKKKNRPTPAPRHTRKYGEAMTGYQLEHGAQLMSIESPFASLNLREATQKVKGVRCRQHVNPLSEKFRAAAISPKWNAIFEDLSLPLVIDVGCGGGRFPLAMAKVDAKRNYLGVDVREALVERGGQWSEFAGVEKNVAFIAGNCTVSLKPWIEDYHDNNNKYIERRGMIELVCIQFPDPHFKRKHWKRRVVQKELVDALKIGLKSGAKVFLQSDVKEVAEDMRDKFEKFGSDSFVVDDELHFGGRNSDLTFEADAPDLVDWEDDEQNFIPTWFKYGWLKVNPNGVPTEREVQTISEGEPVFRVMLRKM